MFFGEYNHPINMFFSEYNHRLICFLVIIVTRLVYYLVIIVYLQAQSGNYDYPHLLCLY